MRHIWRYVQIPGKTWWSLGVNFWCFDTFFGLDVCRCWCRWCSISTFFLQVGFECHFLGQHLLTAGCFTRLGSGSCLRMQSIRQLLPLAGDRGCRCHLDRWWWRWSCHPEGCWSGHPGSLLDSIIDILLYLLEGVQFLHSCSEVSILQRNVMILRLSM